MSGVATSNINGDVSFESNDEVVITMHVNIPDVVPVQSKLKTVTVELAGSGSSHVLFDNYAVTAKGAANNLVHSAADDTTDATTFRLTSLVIDMPTEDPVFIASGSVDPYTIYSMATVEYLTSAGRRVADVSTIRSSPASMSTKRGLKSFVDVVAATNVNVNSGSALVAGQEALSSGGNASSGSNATGSSARMSTIIIIGVGAFVGTAFIIAGAVFLVKSRWTGESKSVSDVKLHNSTSTSAAVKSASSVPAQSPSAPVAPVTLKKAESSSSTPRAVAAMVSAATASASEEDVDLDISASSPTSSKPSRKSSKKLRTSSSTGSGSAAGSASEDSAAAAHRKMRKAARKIRATTTSGSIAE